MAPDHGRRCFVPRPLPSPRARHGHLVFEAAVSRRKQSVRSRMRQAFQRSRRSSFFPATWHVHVSRRAVLRCSRLVDLHPSVARYATQQPEVRHHAARHRSIVITSPDQHPQLPYRSRNRFRHQASGARQNAVAFRRASNLFFISYFLKGPIRTIFLSFIFVVTAAAAYFPSDPARGSLGLREHRLLLKHTQLTIYVVHDVHDIVSIHTRSPRGTVKSIASIPSLMISIGSWGGGGGGGITVRERRLPAPQRFRAAPSAERSRSIAPFYDSHRVDASLPVSRSSATLANQRVDSTDSPMGNPISQQIQRTTLPTVPH